MPSLNEYASFVVPDHVMSRCVGDETVILDLETGIYFGLDAVGSRCWQLLSEGTPLDRICEVLLRDYDVPAAQLKEDVLRLAEQLQHKGLISAA